MKKVALPMDAVMKVSRHFHLSPEKVFFEGAKWSGYHDFPRIAKTWHSLWLIEEVIHNRMRAYLKSVMEQTGLK